MQRLSGSGREIAAGVVLAVVALTVGCSALVATSIDSSGEADLTEVSSGGALGDVAPTL